jgi:hypothetical protein
MKNGLCQDCQKSLKNIIDNQWESKPTKILLIILSQEFRNNHIEPRIQSKLSSLYIQLSKNWKGLFLEYATFWCTLKNGLLESKYIKNKKSPLNEGDLNKVNMEIREHSLHQVEMFIRGRGHHQ